MRSVQIVVNYTVRFDRSKEFPSSWDRNCAKRGGDTFPRSCRYGGYLSGTSLYLGGSFVDSFARGYFSPRVLGFYLHFGGTSLVESPSIGFLETSLRRGFPRGSRGSRESFFFRGGFFDSLFSWGVLRSEFGSSLRRAVRNYSPRGVEVCNGERTELFYKMGLINPWVVQI